MPQHLLLSLYASLSGVAFAVIAVAYRLGQARGLRPLQILALAVLSGTVFFALQPAPAQSTPLFVIVLGIVSGVTQYAAIRLVYHALHLGPLSPLWCMISLNFIPATLYSWLIYHHPLAAMQIVGLLLAVACAVLASRQDKPPHAASGPPHPLLYTTVLIAVFACNSFVNLAMADLKDHLGYATPLFETHGDRFLMVMYGALAVCLWTDLGVSRVRAARPALVAVGGPGNEDVAAAPTSAFSWRVLLALLLLAAVGSNGGLLLTRMSGSLPASITFTLSGMASLLTGGLVSVLFFRERASPAWYAMMLCGAASVSLVNLAGKS